MQQQFDCYYFIASYHALTTLKDPKLLKQYILEVTATYLALGLDPEASTFYLQEAVPEVTELAFIFNCLTSIPFLERSHAYKSAIEHNQEPNAGLLTYPVLMAADILLFQADKVPVGKDQIQHIEICRDIAQKFNYTYGQFFNLPEPYIQAEGEKIIGLDGQKMSKSYGNTIELFLSSKELKQKIMSIKTDCLSLEDKKDPEVCNIFSLYKLFGSAEEIDNLADKYKAGGFGYGHAKIELFNKVEQHFSEARDKYHNLIKNPDNLIDILNYGNKKVKLKAKENMEKIREVVGLF